MRCRRFPFCVDENCTKYEFFFFFLVGSAFQHRGTKRTRSSAGSASLSVVLYCIALLRTNHSHVGRLCGDRVSDEGCIVWIDRSIFVSRRKPSIRYVCMYPWVFQVPTRVLFSNSASHRVPCHVSTLGCAKQTASHERIRQRAGRSRRRRRCCTAAAARAPCARSFSRARWPSLPAEMVRQSGRANSDATSL